MLKKNMLWSVFTFFMVSTLILVACGGPPAAPTTTTPGTSTPAPTTPGTTAPTTTVPKAELPETTLKASTDKPKYGGTLTIARPDVTNWNAGTGTYMGAGIQQIWSTDWAKGPAGGYGSGETTLDGGWDVFELLKGEAAESIDWTFDFKTDQGAFVFKIRQGQYYHMIPGNEASALVGGREMTADDVVSQLKWYTTSKESPQYNSVPLQLRDEKLSKITKTGPWEVTWQLPATVMVETTSFFGKGFQLRAPEIEQKYGNYSKWQHQISAASFMLVDVVPGSSQRFIRHPNYWMEDPIGPGKGNHLPYVDAVNLLIIPDVSTQHAALRTGKLDQIHIANQEDKTQLKRTTPHLMEKIGWPSGSTELAMLNLRVDIPPTNDVRVRRALMMATDFEAILQNVNQGLGYINSYPFLAFPGQPYELLYVDHKSPELSQEARELFVYNPEKARQLLKEAGYPNGFKVAVLTTAPLVDYVSIYKDMWSKVGVEVEFMVRDNASSSGLIANKQHPPLQYGGVGGSVARFVFGGAYGFGNPVSMVSGETDPTIAKMIAEMGEVALTDLKEAMRIARRYQIDYIIPNVFGIPTPAPPHYVLWQPWVKNFNGERYGHGGVIDTWPTYVWIDQELKKSMGY